MRHVIHPTLTECRRKWLEHLRDDGPDCRPRGSVGYDCMQLKWTAWWVTLDDGRQMFMDEARLLFPEPDFYWNHIIRDDQQCTREMITPAGLEMLERPA